MTADMHTHSNASPDAESSMSEIIKAGIEAGAVAVCVTDHCEIGDWDGEWGANNTDNSYRTYSRLKDKKILLFGIEIGGADADYAAAERIAERYPYDFILGSVHNIVGMRDFYYLDYDKINADELLSRYFKAEEEIIANSDFDSLAHLTYPLRYIPEDKYDMRRHEEEIERVLVKLIKSGRALEVNTSGLRSFRKVTYPDEKTVALYKKLGGKLITLGSDGHFPNDVCAGIDETEKMLAKLGFESVTVYKARCPEQIKLNLEKGEE